MKHWWQTVVKDYLTFSKRERNGLLFLLLIGLIIYFLPEFFKSPYVIVDKTAFEKEIAQLKVSIDTAKDYINRFNNDRDDNRGDYLEPKNYYDNNRNVEGELFAFDPNTIDAAGWRRLGLTDRTISTIQRFTAKGFKFRKPEDIRRIYGLRPGVADRLIPYIHIRGTDNNQPEYSSNRTNYTSNTYASNSTGSSRPDYPVTNSIVPKPKIIDINAADISDFIALPGIGAKLASRIVNFRDKLGGFYSVEQVAETYGVADSTFQKIKPRLQCNALVKKININEADINEFRTHPYIRYAIANALINFRRQHGTFKSVDDIRQIHIITEEVFKKIAPYLTI